MFEWPLGLRWLLCPFDGRLAPQGRERLVSQLPMRDRQELVQSQFGCRESLSRIAGQLHLLSCDIRTKQSGLSSAKRVSRAAHQMRVRAHRLHMGRTVPRAGRAQQPVRSSQQARSRDNQRTQGEGRGGGRGAAVNESAHQCALVREGVL